jgi:hypothetical protein
MAEASLEMALSVLRLIAPAVADLKVTRDIREPASGC